MAPRSVWPFVTLCRRNVKASTLIHIDYWLFHFPEINQSLFTHICTGSLFKVVAGVLHIHEIRRGCRSPEPRWLCNSTSRNLECLMGLFCFKWDWAFKKGLCKKNKKKKTKPDLFLGLGLKMGQEKLVENSIKTVTNKKSEQLQWLIISDNDLMHYCAFLNSGQQIEDRYHTERLNWVKKSDPNGKIVYIYWFGQVIFEVRTDSCS